MGDRRWKVAWSKLCLELVQVLCLSKVCPIGDGRAMDHLFWYPNFVLSLSMYRVCPKYVHIKSLCRLCLIVKFAWCLKMFLDNDWTKFWFPSPISVQTHLLMTEFWQTLYLCWTGYGQTLYMDRLLTDIWQRLNRDWIFCPMSVQHLSDHTRTRSTLKMRCNTKKLY